jgi:hypothetical protein
VVDGVAVTSKGILAEARQDAAEVRIILVASDPIATEPLLILADSRAILAAPCIGGCSHSIRAVQRAHRSHLRAAHSKEARRTILSPRAIRWTRSDGLSVAQFIPVPQIALITCVGVPHLVFPVPPSAKSLWHADNALESSVEQAPVSAADRQAC